MSLQDDSIDALVGAVADGSAVDWDQAESSASSDHDRQLIAQLRSLAAAADAARAPQRTWGPLEIHQEIGRGSFGIVYRARDRHLARNVALKLLGQSSDDGALGCSAIREGRLLAQIRHPNVVTVYGADRFDDTVGIWMELVSGHTLKDILQTQGPFGPQEAALIGRDVCRALATVHRQGFFHGDVKAQNVMREDGGRIVLMDFGASDRATSAGAWARTAGTPAYLAPEILGGGPASVASDIYSLGVLLFHLVTGGFPVVGRSLDDLRDKHAGGRRQRLRDARPDLPADFVKAVDRATAANSAERPESAGAMEALLEQALEVATGAAAGAESGARRPSYHEQVPRTWSRWVAAAVAMTLVMVAISAIMRSSASRPAIVRRDSVAIVPFSTAGGSPDGDYLANGITQDVVAHLASLRDVHIIAGASTLRYQGRNATPREIGRDLGVATVLDGNVQRSGNRLRIVSHLTDAATGEQLWSEVFERNVDDVLALQAEVSRKIALALRGELSEADAERFRPKDRRSFETLSRYLKGRNYAGLRTEDGLNRGIALYNDVIAAAPEFAPAHAGLAEAYVALGTYAVLPRSEAYVRAAAAAARAISLDETLPEAHAALGYAHKNRFEWAQAEAEFKRAIELRPGYATAHHWYSIYLTQRGRFPEATTEIKAAIALDPLSIGANLQLAGLLLMAHRFEDAIVQWQRTIQMDAGFVNAYRGIATAYAYLGLHDRARQAIDEAVKHANAATEDQELHADRAYVLALAGHKDEARKIVQALTDRQMHTGEVLAGSIASIYVALGDSGRAFEWLTRACESKDPEVGYLVVDPRWDPIRSDSRFVTLRRGLGL